MLPWTHLDTAPVPGGSELRLMQRGEEFSIKLGKNELMSSRMTVTEQALATIACDKIKTRAGVKLLIGGLGMGFTLRAALTILKEDAEIVVVELVPKVVAWARGPMAALFGGSLTDPRVTIQERDVVDAIAAARADYDAILLDVDNGPNGIVRKTNDRLYDVNGLAAAHKALRPGGVLAVWSSTTDAKFTGRLRKGGFDVTEHPVRAKSPHGRAQHLIWVARRA
jgi:spermidine synthase